MLQLTNIYLAVSFAFAWICWLGCWVIINHHLGLSLVGMAILGSFGPFIAAGLCNGLSIGLSGMWHFYARAL